MHISDIYFFYKTEELANTRKMCSMAKRTFSQPLIFANSSFSQKIEKIKWFTVFEQFKIFAECKAILLVFVQCNKVMFLKVDK